MKKHSYQVHGRQRGAALVIGLLLLVILTLLAISGMNTASTELVMAGNEQYRQRASQAAGTGIEQALVVLYTVPQNKDTVVSSPQTAIDGSSPDTYQTDSRFMGEDLNIPGYSAGKYAGYHYEITSTGRSARNAQTVDTVGAFVVQHK